MKPRDAVIEENMLELEDALRELGVTCAGTHDDPYRWSVSDLAKDLAIKLKPRKGPCGMPHHAADCICDGEAGDR